MANSFLNDFPPQFVAFGLLILIFGFLGFNASSQLSSTAAGDGVVIMSSAFNTLLAGCIGSITVLLINKRLSGHWSYIAAANGSVCAMAAICAGCDSVQLWGAALIGILAGIAFLLGRHLLDKMHSIFQTLPIGQNNCFHFLYFPFFHQLTIRSVSSVVNLENVVVVVTEEKRNLFIFEDAFPVHFCGGVTGILTAPLFVADGVFLKWDSHSFAVNCRPPWMGWIEI